MLLAFNSLCFGDLPDEWPPANAIYSTPLC